MTDVFPVFLYAFEGFRGSVLEEAFWNHSTRSENQKASSFWSPNETKRAFKQKWKGFLGWAIFDTNVSIHITYTCAPHPISDVIIESEFWITRKQNIQNIPHQNPLWFLRSLWARTGRSDARAVRCWYHYQDTEVKSMQSGWTGQWNALSETIFETIKNRRDAKCYSLASWAGGREDRSEYGTRSHGKTGQMAQMSVCRKSSISRLASSWWWKSKQNIAIIYVLWSPRWRHLRRIHWSVLRWWMEMRCAPFGLFLMNRKVAEVLSCFRLSSRLIKTSIHALNEDLGHI